MTFEENKCKYHASNLLTDGFMLSDNNAWTVVVRVLESDNISGKKKKGHLKKDMTMSAKGEDELKWWITEYQTQKCPSYNP